MVCIASVDWTGSGPVRDVQVSHVTSDSFRIKWSSPSFTGGALSRYSLSYAVTQMSDCAVDDVEWSSPLYDIPAGQMTHQVSGLHANSRYQVALWAETEAGSGRKTMHTVKTLSSGEDRLNYSSGRVKSDCTFGVFLHIAPCCTLIYEINNIIIKISDSCKDRGATQWI